MRTDDELYQIHEAAARGKQADWSPYDGPTWEGLRAVYEIGVTDAEAT